VTQAEVVGLSEDGARLVLRVGWETVEVPLEDVRRAERRATQAPVPAEPLTPRLIQLRIRCGETAEQVAASGGWEVEVVRRYEGPVLAEREHHATQARRSETDGRLVEELVSAHLGEPPEAVEWDSWLVDDGRWEVQASAAGQAVRLRWDPASRRVHAVDEPARRALRVASVDDDVLTAVLRPVSRSRDDGPAPAQPPRPNRRAEVPGWADIARQVSGREQQEE
jgi:hypothetical protein